MSPTKEIIVWTLVLIGIVAFTAIFTTLFLA